MKLYVLSYASFNCSDYELFDDIIGIYTAKEEAIAALKMNVGHDIVDGDSEFNWDVKETDAEYYCDYNNEYKKYHIKEVEA